MIMKIIVTIPRDEILIKLNPQIRITMTKAC